VRLKMGQDSIRTVPACPASTLKPLISTHELHFRKQRKDYPTYTVQNQSNFALKRLLGVTETVTVAITPRAS
jgi:hypothetical protein